MGAGPESAGDTSVMRTDGRIEPEELVRHVAVRTDVVEGEDVCGSDGPALVRARRGHAGRGAGVACSRRTDAPPR